MQYVGTLLVAFALPSTGAIEAHGFDVAISSAADNRDGWGARAHWIADEAVRRLALRGESPFGPRLLLTQTQLPLE